MERREWEGESEIAASTAGRETSEGRTKGSEGMRHHTDNAREVRGSERGKRSE